MRTAACFGGFALVIPTGGSCEVNETVLHVASGGENYIKISRVSDLTGAVIKAKGAGYAVMGTLVGEEADDIYKVSLSFPLAFVLGSEGKGIRPDVKKHLDIKARIPMEGASLSFNVNMACAIFCYEVCKQRGRYK
jgi:23S rRNA (guanosine2251-2'-O)-methyltransferase